MKTTRSLAAALGGSGPRPSTRGRPALRAPAARTSALCSLFLGTLTACTGVLETPTGGPNGCPPGDPSCAPAHASCEGDPSEATALAQHPLRRLSETEYHNTIRDLFQGVPYDETELVPALTAGGFENFVANTRAVSDRDVEAFNVTVDSVAARASTDAAFLARHGCDDPAQQSACIDGFVRQFGLRAFRRPLTSDEEAVYRALIEETAATIDLAAGIETMIASLLMSPELLYRVERRGQDAAGPYEVASRLSYLIWQSMPDDALFAAAAADELSTPEEREAQARRMLSDARATEAIVDFHRQWFRFSRMDEDKYAAKSPTRFPEWTTELRASVHEEVRRFVRHVAEEDTTLARLYTDRTAFVDQEMADHYGVSAPGDWSEVELPASERSGILTRANFLAGTGIAGHGSPVHRGIFVYENLLCQHIGGVPDGVDTSAVNDPPPDQTTRELYAEITSPGACRSCHARVNPVGFSFEHYTSTGAYRTTEVGRDIDATGALVGSEFESEGVSDAVELSDQLAASEMAHACASNKWVSYMLGRRLDETSQDDACYSSRIQQVFWESGGDMRELLVSLVTQPEFVGGAQ